jgi:L-rhamnose isomerase / sugar isomerase
MVNNWVQKQLRSGWQMDPIFRVSKIFGRRLERTRDSLEKIYRELPPGWKMLIEYKPYEPNFYSMVIPDWGTSFLLASKLGDKAETLVDLGHHLPNTNIEQIVATLLTGAKTGWFSF